MVKYDTETRRQIIKAQYELLRLAEMIGDEGREKRVYSMNEELKGWGDESEDGDGDKRFNHAPFSYPCPTKNCANKIINGRCSLDYRDEDKHGNCKQLTPKPK